MSKLAIITGASTGIGAATAARLQRAGFSVISIARRDCEVEHVVSINADLTQPLQNDAQKQLIDACVNSEQVALVHCAGWLTSDTAQTVAADALQHALQVNVQAPAMLNGLLLPHLPAGSGIIFVSSTLGSKAVPGALSYVTSKHAVDGLMRATCQDLAGSGVHTACVSPGFTDTQMLRNHVGHDQQILDSIASGVTFNRLIDPDEIAATIAFCIANPVINGSVIHANLGQIER
ncbi:MAG: SDR family oxidoreductase [Pseudomonadota bacterium]